MLYLVKLKINTFVCLLFISSLSYGQVATYRYKREIKGIEDQWHKIMLPDELFGHVSQDLSDLRIFGITASNDTIEAPYLLRLMADKVSAKNVAFKILNISHTDKGYYFTFEVPATEPINQLKLDFKQKNFDWQTKLEGSQNLNDWFTICDKYRILSIHNDITDFQFTQLVFPNSTFRYFRLFINSNENPDLVTASISHNETTAGAYRNYAIRKWDVQENKETKQSEITIELNDPVPICQVEIDVKNTLDYYRPVTIEYLADSFNTQQGWKYEYRTLTTGTLNSIEKNAFKFNSTTVQKLKILIHNDDNQPLNIDSVEVKGYVHELVTRFTEPAAYFLAYGNPNATSPNYDIARFIDKVPEPLNVLSLGDEQVIEKEGASITTPLFENKMWLWLIMTVLILILGWFSVKMMRKNQ